MVVSDTTVKSLEAGYVLSRKGDWISIDQAIAEEQAYCRRVYDGDVVIDGRWMPLDSIPEPESPQEKSVASPKLKRGDPMDDRETKIISVADLDAHIKETASGDARETRSLEISEDDAIALDDIAEDSDDEELKPDTVRMEIGLGQQGADEAEVRTGKTDTIPVAGAAEDQDKSRNKLRYIIIGSLAAASLIAAGILVILRFAM